MNNLGSKIGVATWLNHNSNLPLIVYFLLSNAWVSLHIRLLSEIYMPFGLILFPFLFVLLYINNTFQALDS